MAQGEGAGVSGGAGVRPVPPSLLRPDHTCVYLAIVSPSLRTHARGICSSQSFAKRSSAALAPFTHIFSVSLGTFSDTSPVHGSTFCTCAAVCSAQRAKNENLPGTTSVTFIPPEPYTYGIGPAGPSILLHMYATTFLSRHHPA